MTRLSDLPEAVQAELKKLSRETIHDIAAQVHIEAVRASERAYPSDPSEAFAGVHKSIRKDVNLEVEEPVEYVLDVLTMLRGMCLAALSPHDSMDKPNLETMCRQIDNAWYVLSQHEAGLREACARLRQIERHQPSFEAA